MMHLNQSNPESGELSFWGPFLRLEWAHELTGCRWNYTVTLRQTGEGINLSEETLRRLVCHAIIAHLPEMALSEASESLAEIYEYYRTLLPVQATVPVLVPPAPIQARWGDTYERASFHIDED
jgi:hypothetical protein